MKKQAQKYELGTKEELDIKSVQNQKFLHEPTYLRIKKEINDLDLQLSQDEFQFYLIEQTKKRIVLRIFYFLKNQAVCDQNQKNKKWQVKKGQNKFSNIVQEFQKGNRNFMTQKNGEQENKNKKYEEQENLREGLKKSYVIFTCIIQYDIYPFSPPYLFLTGDNSLQKTIGVNDFRNIVEDLFEGIDWFPIYGLFDIFVKIPYFIEKINKNQSIMQSNFYCPKPFTKKDIDLYAPGIKLCQAQFYDSKDALVGKHIILEFNYLQKNRLRKNHDSQNLQPLLNSTIQDLRELEKNKIHSQNRYKFVTNQTNEKFQTKSRFQRTNRENYLNWMKLCLLNSQLYKQSNTNKIKTQTDKIKVIKQVIDKRIHNIDRLSNQSSFFTNTKETKKLQPSQKQQKEQNILQKQQILSMILESLDLFLSSQKYSKYQNQTHQNEIQQIFLQNKSSQRYQKGKQRQHGNSKLTQGQIDLVKLQYQKLFQYKIYIENERKRIFDLM